VNELPFTELLQQKYAFKKGPFSQPNRCWKFDPTAAGFEAAQSQKQRVEDVAKQNKSKTSRLAGRTHCSASMQNSTIPFSRSCRERTDPRFPTTSNTKWISPPPRGSIARRTLR
jgi:hypothetical protein